MRNAIERAVGTNPEVAPDLTSVSLMQADRLLLCSDGLWGLVDDRTIQGIINRRSRAGTKVQGLLKLALDAGGSDNITLILLEIGR